MLDLRGIDQAVDRVGGGIARGDLASANQEGFVRVVAGLTAALMPASFARSSK